MDLALVLADAYRRATDRHDSVVKHADVLTDCVRRVTKRHSILRSTMARISVPATMETPSIGAGLIANSIHDELACVLRSAAWHAVGVHGVDVASGPSAPWPRWDESLTAILGRAFTRTRNTGLSFVSPLQVLLSSPDAWSGIEDGVITDIERAGLLDVEGRPPTFLIERLEAYGYLASPLARYGLGRRRRQKFGRTMRNGPIVNLISQEAINQCVRLAHEQVSLLHLLLATLSLQEQILISGAKIRTDLLPHNDALRIFSRHGLTYRKAIHETAELPPPDAPSTGHRVLGDHPSNWYPEWTDIALIIVGCAADVASHLGQTGVGADHVVVGVLSKADDPVEALFDRCDVSFMDVKSELEKRMGFE